MVKPKQRGINNPKIDSLPPTPEDWVSQRGESSAEPKTEALTKKRITLTVSEELHKRVHIYARTKGMTVTDLVTEFLENLTS